MRTFKFQFQLTWINLAAVLGFAAVVTLGCFFTGGEVETDNLFSMYFGMFPLMGVLMLYIFAYGLCTSNLNLALSFGGRRRDFFWSLQGTLAVYTAVLWGLQLVMTAIPGWFSWENPGTWYILLSMGDLPWWIYPLICFAALCLGCLSGLVFMKSRVWGILLILAVCGLGVFSAVALLLTANKQVYALWGDLPWVLAAGMGIAILVSELVIWRFVSRSVVR